MRKPDHVESIGNVFADLRLPKAGDLLAKAELAVKIVQEIERRQLTQSEAAAVLGVDQPKVSALKQGKLSGFSIERLIRFLLALGTRCRDHSETQTQVAVRRPAARGLMPA